MTNFTILDDDIQKISFDYEKIIKVNYFKIQDSTDGNIVIRIDDLPTFIRLLEIAIEEVKEKSLNELKTIETKEDILEHFKPDGISISEYSVEDVEYEVIENVGIVSGKGTIAGSYNEFEFALIPAIHWLILPGRVPRLQN